MDYPQNLTESDRCWYDLIQKCRTSGKTDSQWLKENNIKPPTFYYHVKQLRKKACELPKAAKRTSTAEVQEVVPVFFKEEEVSVPTAPIETVIPEVSNNTVAVRLKIHDICVEISNSASNVFQYIYTLLLYMPGYKSGSAGIEQLLPWSDFIKEHCSGLIDVETITVEEHPTLSFD